VDDLEDRPQYFFDVQNDVAVEEGTITAVDSEEVTVTDSTKDWTLGEHVGKVVAICFNGCYIYAMVLDNTADTIVLDEWSAGIDVDMTYVIIEPYFIDETKLPAVVAIDNSVNPVAVVLPQSTEAIERKSIHIYVEKHVAETQCRVPVIARLGDTFLGSRYSTLEDVYEGVTMLPHQFLTSHFDVVSVYKIKRYAYLSTAADVAVDDTDYIDITHEFAAVETTSMKRFSIVEVDTDDNVIEYTSLIPTEFSLTGLIHITKTGAGAGELTTAVSVTRGDTTTVFDDFASTTRFGAGEGAAVVSLDVPITLNKFDKIKIIAKRTAGTFTIDAGSTVKISEL
jgi:hypothetical protein